MKIKYKLIPGVYRPGEYEFFDKGGSKVVLTFVYAVRDKIREVYKIWEHNYEIGRSEFSTEFVELYSISLLTLVFKSQDGTLVYATYTDAPGRVDIVGKLEDNEHLPIEKNWPQKDEYAYMEIEYPNEKQTVIAKTRWILADENTGEILYNREVNTENQPGSFYSSGKWTTPVYNKPNVWEETIFHKEGTIVLSKKEYELKFLTNN